MKIDLHNIVRSFFVQKHLNAMLNDQNENKLNMAVPQIFKNTGFIYG